MAELTRRHIAFIAFIAIAVTAAIVALAHWESGRECVRWSTRVDMDEYGRLRRTQVCAEFGVRRDRGDDEDTEQRGPKGK